MRIARQGKEYLKITEENYRRLCPVTDKVHLVHISFQETPNSYTLDRILELYDQTNRFIIDSDIRFYNDYFKRRNKKYYVMNNYEDKDILSFFRKNNKIAFSFIEHYYEDELNIFSLELIKGILRNSEVVMANESILDDFLQEIIDMLEWQGNVVLINE